MRLGVRRRAPGDERDPADDRRRRRATSRLPTGSCRSATPSTSTSSRPTRERRLHDDERRLRVGDRLRPDPDDPEQPAEHPDAGGARAGRAAPSRSASERGATRASIACSTMPTLKRIEASSAARRPEPCTGPSCPCAGFGDRRLLRGQEEPLRYRSATFRSLPGPDSHGVCRPTRQAVTHHMEFDKFAIGFDHRDRERLHALWDGILDDNQWSDGAARQGLRGGLGGLERAAVGRDLEPGRARRSPRSSSSSCAARPSSAPRTPSWRRRSRSSRRARGSSSSTATATTSACRSPTSSARSHEHKPAAVDPRPHRRAHRLRGRADRRALPRRGDRPDRGLRALPRRLLERAQARHLR